MKKYAFRACRLAAVHRTAANRRARSRTAAAAGLARAARPRYGRLLESTKVVIVVIRGLRTVGRARTRRQRSKVVLEKAASGTGRAFQWGSALERIKDRLCSPVRPGTGVGQRPGSGQGAVLVADRRGRRHGNRRRLRGRAGAIGPVTGSAVGGVRRRFVGGQRRHLGRGGRAGRRERVQMIRTAGPCRGRGQCAGDQGQQQTRQALRPAPVCKRLCYHVSGSRVTERQPFPCSFPPKYARPPRIARIFSRYQRNAARLFV
jgi:hypothetical protein